VAYTDELSGTAQVDVYDRAARTTKLVSATADGAPGDFDSTTARTGRAVSDDGRWVVFGSVATNLTMPAGVPGEQVAADPTPDVYLADRITSTVVRVSAGAGLVPGDGASAAASISGDGRSVVYQTVANDLGDVDLTSGYDVYGYDVTTLSSSLLSRASDGTQANADAYWPTVSRDGSVVAFASAATNLVPADTNGQPDVFVRARP
jgi:Tol biopolymer transport system component